jgi:hypothetical protein
MRSGATRTAGGARRHQGHEPQADPDRRPLGHRLRNGAASGPKDTLFFAAGPDDETHGLFGSITPPTQ